MVEWKIPEKVVFSDGFDAGEIPHEADVVLLFLFCYRMARNHNVIWVF